MASIAGLSIAKILALQFANNLRLDLGLSSGIMQLAMKVSIVA